MAAIPSARLSPRIENGVLHWYQGDRFSLCLVLQLQDQDGETVEIKPASDQVEVRFFDAQRQLVQAFLFGGEEGEGITDNRLTLSFDSDVTALFPRGDYHYDVIYTGGSRTVTLVAAAPARVS